MRDTLASGNSMLVSIGQESSNQAKDAGEPKEPLCKTHIAPSHQQSLQGPAAAAVVRAQSPPCSSLRTVGPPLPNTKYAVVLKPLKLQEPRDKQRSVIRALQSSTPFTRALEAPPAHTH